MKTPQQIILPVPLYVYEQNHEAVHRKTTEQFLQDLRDDIVDGRKKTSRDESLSLRRFQFLMMGAN